MAWAAPAAAPPGCVLVEVSTKLGPQQASSTLTTTSAMPGGAGRHSAPVSKAVRFWTSQLLPAPLHRRTLCIALDGQQQIKALGRAVSTVLPSGHLQPCSCSTQRCVLISTQIGARVFFQLSPRIPLHQAGTAGEHRRERQDPGQTAGQSPWSRALEELPSPTAELHSQNGNHRAGWQRLPLSCHSPTR